MSELSGAGPWESWYPDMPYDATTNPSPYGDPQHITLVFLDDLQPGSRILDVAGGYGRYAIPLAEQGHHVTVVDADKAHLAEADRRGAALPPGSGTITTVQADLTKELPDSISPHDALLCAGFLYLAPRDVISSMFRNMAAAVRSGGLAVVEFATNRVRRTLSGDSLMGQNEYNYTRQQGEELLVDLYDENGFDQLQLVATTVHFEEPYYLHNDLVIARGIKR